MLYLTAGRLEFSLSDIHDKAAFSPTAPPHIPCSVPLSSESSEAPEYQKPACCLMQRNFFPMLLQIFFAVARLAIGFIYRSGFGIVDDMRSQSRDFSLVIILK